MDSLENPSGSFSPLLFPRCEQTTSLVLVSGWIVPQRPRNVAGHL